MEDVLLVDDEYEFSFLVMSFLRSVGISAKCVDSGEKALVELEKTNFKLLITDLNMPGISGCDVARKAVTLFPELPVILMTAHELSKVIEAAKNAGIRQVITKPFRIDQLLDAIDAATGGAVKARK